MNLIKNVKECYAHIPYTWNHYKAFRAVEIDKLGYSKHWHHDWDKLFLYIFFPFLGKRIIKQIHQKYQKHHPTYTTGIKDVKHYKDPKKIDWKEAIIDWECAHLTKPDKSLDAYDTLYKFYPEYAAWALPVLEKFNLIHE